jgi:hypothetical protein
VSFDLAGKSMIKVQIRVRTKGDGFIVVACAESIGRAAQIVKERYPGSVVEIAFPIAPGQFFVGDPHYGERIDLEAKERMQVNQVG